MSNFFAFPTVNSWEEDVFQLTGAGIALTIILIIACIALALFLQPKDVRNMKFSTKQLTFSAMAMALATVLSMIKLFDMPMGGSVTLCSMFFITLTGYIYGPKAGLLTGFSYGLLQFVIDPVFYTLPQMLIDYPLAFGALGISGFFWRRKWGLQIGYVAGIIGRFIFSWFSGFIFFAAYAEGSGMSPVLYSLAYNGSYIAAEGIITLIIISIPPVFNAVSQIKKGILA